MTILISYFISFIAFVVIFSVLILIHELGHFLAAKRADIKVEEFGMGLPPKAKVLFKKGETEYTLNWIPFGGFVRMVGEDDRDGKSANDPRSFQNKTLWQRTLVIIAGVCMNYILAVVLLTIGFLFGMNPILLGLSDIAESVENKQITLQTHAIVESVDENSQFASSGLQKGDQIFQINDETINFLPALESAKNQEEVTIHFLRNNTKQSINIALNNSKEPLAGVNFYDLKVLPTVFIENIEDNSKLFGTLQNGDRVIEVNGKRVFSRKDFADEVFNNTSAENTIIVLRDHKISTLEFSSITDEKEYEEGEESGVVISSVVPDSPAEKGGLESQDKVVRINGNEIKTPSQLTDGVKSDVENTLEVIRNNQPVTLAITPTSDGKMGAYLSQLYTNDALGVDLYEGFTNFSVTEYADIQWYMAPILGVTESFKITQATTLALGDVFSQLIFRFNLPEGVAGPVGIASLTHDFAQQGIIPLLQLAALLSLSLAVFNILPFPALDGGRLVFIVYEAVTGKKANQKVEAIAHTIGFVFLLLLILIVTFHDVLKFFQ